MRSRVLAVCSVIAIAAASAVAIGGSASAQGSNGKFTGDPVKIGVTFPCDAPVPPAICEAGPAAQAAAKSFNASGGLKTADGMTHKIEVVLCNNENDRATTADCAREFIDEGVAFVTGAATFADEIVPQLGAANIAYFAPLIASDGSTEGTAPNSYVLGFTLGLFQGITEQLVDAGYTNTAVVAQGAGSQLLPLTQPIAEAAGGSQHLVEVPQENPNWAQAVEEATSDADSILMIVSEEGTKAFVDAYRQAGKDLPIAATLGIITNDLVQATGGSESPLVGGIATGYFPPPQDKAWADFRKGMKKYAKGTQIDPAGQSVWLAIELGKVIIEDASEDATTGETFIAAVDATTDIPTLDGKLPSGKSFQVPEGVFPRIFNNDYWGPLKITGKGIGNGKGAQFQPAPSAT